MPLLLKTEDETIKLIFYALVVPNLTIPMFISANSWLQTPRRFTEELYASNPPVFTIDIGRESFRVRGV